MRANGAEILFENIMADFPKSGERHIFTDSRKSANPIG